MPIKVEQKRILTFIKANIDKLDSSGYTNSVSFPPYSNILRIVVLCPITNKEHLNLDLESKLMTFPLCNEAYTIVLLPQSLANMFLVLLQWRPLPKNNIFFSISRRNYLETKGYFPILLPKGLIWVKNIPTKYSWLNIPYIEP